MSVTGLILPDRICAALGKDLLGVVDHVVCAERRVAPAVDAGHPLQRGAARTRTNTSLSASVGLVDIRKLEDTVR